MESRRIIPPTPPFGQPAVPRPIANPLSIAAVVTAMPPIKLDAAGRIDDDVVCRKCDYNLRGLTPEGRCPECGTAIGRSLGGDLLRFSDPEWVQKLASGMNWIVASIFIAFLGGVFGAILFGLFASTTSSRSYLFLSPLASLAFGAVALIGYWKITTPDPARLSGESNFSARKIVRIAQVTQYAIAPINSLIQQWALAIPIFILSAVSGIVGLVGVFATFIYGRKLALRIPDEKLARHCRIVMWGLAAMLALSSVFAIYIITRPPQPAPTTTAPAALTTTNLGATRVTTKFSASTKVSKTGTKTVTMTSTRPPFSMAAMAAYGCIMAVGGLTFGIWALRLLFRFRTRLRESAEIARQTWAAQPSVVSHVAPSTPEPPARQTNSQP